MKNCDCKHAGYCKIKDDKDCIGKVDPWCKPDMKIMGRTGKEINIMQGRDKELKK